jgi:hypothetical protein
LVDTFAELREERENNLGNDQPGVFLVVGRHDTPGHVPCAGRAEAIVIRLHVLLPEFSLLDINKAKFPVLFRLIDALKKALSLLFLQRWR